MPRQLRAGWRAMPDPFYLDRISGTMLIAWAAYLYTLPPVFGNQRNYDILGAVINEPAAILTACIFGKLQILMAYHICRYGRIFAAFLSGGFWAFVGTAIHLANNQAPGVTIYAGYVVMNMLIIGLLMRPRGQADG